MNKITRPRTSKKIVIMILIVTLFNFVMPNFSRAEEDVEDGGIIFKFLTPIALAIPDLLLQKMQNIFIGDKEEGKRENGIDYDFETSGEEIEIGQENPKKGISAYVILYSPGTIFAGKIPGLDVNFISPMGDENGITKTYFTKYYYGEKPIDHVTKYSELEKKYGFNPKNATQTESSSKPLTYLIWFRERGFKFNLGNSCNKSRNRGTRNRSKYR